MVDFDPELQVKCFQELAKHDIPFTDGMRSAFRDWSLANHPDKGGDNSVYSLVSSCVQQMKKHPDLVKIIGASSGFIPTPLTEKLFDLAVGMILLVLAMYLTVKINYLQAWLFNKGIAKPTEYIVYTVYAWTKFIIITAIKLVYGGFAWGGDKILGITSAMKRIILGKPRQSSQYVPLPIETVKTYQRELDFSSDLHDPNLSRVYGSVKPRRSAKRRSTKKTTRRGRSKYTRHGR